MHFQVKLKYDTNSFDCEPYERMTNEMLHKCLNTNLLNYIRQYFSVLSNLEYKLTEQMQQVNILS